MATFLLVAACASVANQMGSEEPGATDRPEAGDAEEVVESAPEPPPVVDPPEMSEEEWAMPSIKSPEADFPYLPGESREASRSIGKVNSGWLVNAKPIPQPHPHLKAIGEQYERGLNYTSDEMLELIEETGAHVAEEHPGSLVPLGNFSADGGGDIPYSASHNNGRDGDLGFFALDEHGEPVELPDLLSFDARGEYDGEEGEFRFDVERNWTMIEGLIEADDEQRLQYIFISDPLRRLLLREAARSGASRSTIVRARELMRQPGGALPHANHFHIRIHCSETDVRAGCKNQGRRSSGFVDHADARRDAIRGAVEALDHDEAEMRRNAVRRLALLEARGRASEAARLLDDKVARVRAAAARSIGRLGAGSSAIATRLDEEPDGHAAAEMINALGHIGDDAALEALVGQLSERRPLDLAGEYETDGRALAAEAIIEIERGEPVVALIDLLESENTEVRLSAARALHVLTNHRHGTRRELSDDDAVEEIAARWRDWYDEHGHKDRDEWLTCGFRDAGYEVEELSARHVWDLCRAVADDDYLSHNAQRVLMRISGRQPASLSWSKEDANFYWRRWFERRWRTFGAPPIPEELSTLD
ncbi:MAG: HEAT repeat domain-containing protein [Persicimonas sp.]